MKSCSVFYMFSEKENCVLSFFLLFNVLGQMDIREKDKINGTTLHLIAHGFYCFCVLLEILVMITRVHAWPLLNAFS